jgi:hypothetical protein
MAIETSNHLSIQAEIKEMKDILTKNPINPEE